jgi:hypothetical protein
MRCSRIPPEAKANAEAAGMARVLGGDNRPDILLRYETAIERQLYRALDQLERCSANGPAITNPLR